MKRIVYINSHRGQRSQEIYRELLGRLEAGNNDFYYILPNGELINHYRSKFTQDLGANFALNLFTFDDIVDSLIEAGGYKYIDQDMKYFILKKVLKDLAEEDHLSYYSEIYKTRGFIISMIDIIVEFKRSLVLREDLLDWEDDQALAELILIIDAYNKYLAENKLLDREDSYLRALEVLAKESVDLDLGLIVVDEIFDFRPIEMEILRALAREDLDLIINIPYHYPRDNQVLRESVDFLSDLGFSIDLEEEAEEGDFSLLAKNIFNPNYKMELDGISLVEASSMELEVGEVFRQIKNDYLEGTSLENICITYFNDDYIEIIEKKAREEGLPLNKSEKLALVENKFSQDILDLFLVQSKDKLMARLDSFYFNPIGDEALNRDLYRLVRNSSFKLYWELKQDLSTRKDMDEDLREEAIGLVSRLEEEEGQLENLSSLEDYQAYIEEAFISYGLREKLLEIRARDLEDFILESRIIQAVGEEVETIAQHSSLLENLDAGEYREILRDFLNRRELVLEKRNPQGIRVLKLINNRGFSYDSLYLLGLSQSNYPGLGERNFFINERNKDLLLKLGLNYRSYGYLMDNEIVKFSSLVSKTRKKLVLSYTSGEDQAEIGSVFLDDLIRIAGPLETRSIASSQLVEDRSRISNEFALERQVLGSLGEKNWDRDLLGLYNTIFPYKLGGLNERLACERAREEKDFNKYRGKLEAQPIIEDIRDNYRREKYSASYLEAYAACPYSFMLKRFFKIEEAYDQEEMDYLAIGNVYHESLFNYYSSFQKEINSHREDFFTSSQEELDRIFYEACLANQLGNRTREEELLLNIMKDRLYLFIEEDLRRVNENQLQAYSFEEKFGFQEDFSLSLGGDSINLYGVIDRIDLTPEGKALIIDYKTSSGRNFSDMVKGLSLQIPIYILAKKDLLPVAGLYGSINKANYQVATGIKGASYALKNTRANKVDSWEEWEEFLDFVEERIFEIRNNIARGDFSIDPLECSEYCPYKDICRYEVTREGE